MLVSFIIPVYKVEQFLSACVDSILGQTYRNIEVLLIDDGSPDNSPALCDEYAKRDSRVVAYHKPNGGASDTRNYGLERAKGDYVVFMDSDDFWQKETYLDELVDELNNSPECDFIGFNISYYFENSNTYQPWVAYDKKVSGNQPKEEKILWMVNSGTMPMSPCSKIFRRRFLEHEGIRFIKGICSEDIPWFMELLEKCNNFKLANKYVYAYRQGVMGSVTNTFNKKKFNDLFTIVKDGVISIQKSTFSTETKDSLLSFMAYEYLILLASIHRFSDDTVLNKEVKSYQWLLNYTANPKVRMGAKVYQLAGLKTTEWAMRLYNVYRKSK